MRETARRLTAPNPSRPPALQSGQRIKLSGPARPLTRIGEVHLLNTPHLAQETRTASPPTGSISAESVAEALLHVPPSKLGEQQLAQPSRLAFAVVVSAPCADLSPSIRIGWRSPSSVGWRRWAARRRCACRRCRPTARSLSRRIVLNQPLSV